MTFSLELCPQGFVKKGVCDSPKSSIVRNTWFSLKPELIRSDKTNLSVDGAVREVNNIMNRFCPKLERNIV